MLRRWPADRFAHLADWLKGEHQMAVVFTGSSDEMELMQSIQGQMKSNSTIFMGELETLPALIDACSLYVGNESGPLQIADALKKPVLGIFGPGVKDVFYPFQSPNSRVLHHILECNPCDQVHCVRPENPCISLVSKEDAKAAISAMLKSD
jgi:ADP-heptose:LPS heptosyltransferase